jgi:hypothetical protein
MAYDRHAPHAGKHHATPTAFARAGAQPGREYLRANWLSNRAFETYDAIIDAACEAWQKLITQPQTIT